MCWRQEATRYPSFQSQYCRPIITDRRVRHTRVTQRGFLCRAVSRQKSALSDRGGKVTFRHVVRLFLFAVRRATVQSFKRRINTRANLREIASIKEEAKSFSRPDS